MFIILRCFLFSFVMFYMGIFYWLLIQFVYYLCYSVSQKQKQIKKLILHSFTLKIKETYLKKNITIVFNLIIFKMRLKIGSWLQGRQQSCNCRRQQQKWSSWFRNQWQTLSYLRRLPLSALHVWRVIWSNAGSHWKTNVSWPISEFLYGIFHSPKNCCIRKFSFSLS